MRVSLVNGKMLAHIGRLLNIQKFLLLPFHNEKLRSLDNIIEDTLEAFIGAMFLDRGLKGTTDWFIDIVEYNLDFAQLVTTSERDMLSRLYRDNFNKNVNIVATRDNNNMYKVCMYDNDTNELIGEGFGPNRRIASDNAAKKGLDYHGIGHVMSTIANKA